MIQPATSPGDTSDLFQTALHCYLSTILAMSECVATVCPDVGVPYRNRWRRLPQRLGFDSSAKSMERSRRAFELDLEAFTELSRRYFEKGLPLLQSVGDMGRQTTEAILETAASHAVLLETLAESIETAADLDAPPEIRGQLEHQSAGLRKCARQVETQLMPHLVQLVKLVQECEQLVRSTREAIVVDAETGFLNTRGFRKDLEFRLLDEQPCCVLILDCEAKMPTGEECSESVFRRIITALSERIAGQFRPNDCLGRIGPRRFAVIFDGGVEIVLGRMEQMQRSMSGMYPVDKVRIAVTAKIRIIEAGQAQELRNLLNESDVTVAAEPAQAEVA